MSSKVEGNLYINSWPSRLLGLYTRAHGYIVFLQINFPNTVRVLLTKPSNLIGMEEAINNIGVQRILTTPFEFKDLNEVLHSSLEKFDQTLGISLINRTKES